MAEGFNDYEMENFDPDMMDGYDDYQLNNDFNEIKEKIDLLYKKYGDDENTPKGR